MCLLVLCAVSPFGIECAGSGRECLGVLVCLFLREGLILCLCGCVCACGRGCGRGAGFCGLGLEGLICRARILDLRVGFGLLSVRGLELMVWLRLVVCLLFFGC